MRPGLFARALATAVVLAACSGGPDDTAAGDIDRWCTLAREFDEDQQLDVRGIEDETALAETIRDYFRRDEFRERMNEFEAVAPAEIRPHVERIAVATRMAAVGDFTGVNSDEGRQAQAIVAEYRAERCGDGPAAPSPGAGGASDDAA